MSLDLIALSAIALTMLGMFAGGAVYVYPFILRIDKAMGLIPSIQKDLQEIKIRVDEIESIVKISATQNILDRTNELHSAIELEKKKKEIITDLLNQPFYECDENGYAIALNDSLLGVFGMERDAAIGYGWLNAISDGHNLRVKSEWENAVRHHQVEFDTIYRIKKDGKMYRSRAKILRDSSGEIKYIFGTVTPHEKV